MVGKALTCIAVAVLAAVMLGTPAAADHDDRCAVDVVFILDRSTSMAGTPTTMMLAGGNALLDELGTHDRSGVASMTPHPLDKAPNGDHGTTRTALSDPSPSAGGGPGWGGTIATGQSQLTSLPSPKRQVMVLFSDGHNTYADVEADAAKNAGIEIFSVAVGAGADTTHMSNLASLPTADYFRHVVATNQAEAAMADLLALISDCTPPVPDFTLVPTCLPGPTIFRDLTTFSAAASAVRADWDFGDGTTRTYTPPAAVVSHTYATPGTYVVRLDVLDDNGLIGTLIRNITADPCPPEPPVAAFSCATITDPWLRIALLDLSTDRNGPISAWAWDFGDGATASGPSPVHDYAEPGIYQVTLTVTDSDGMQATAVEDCIARLKRPPTIDPVPSVTVHEGEAIAFRVTGSDPDGDRLTFGWQRRALPPAATFIGQEFHWQTRSGDAGYYGAILFQVSDGWRSDATTMSITVLPNPPAPPPRSADADGDGIPDAQDDCLGFCYEEAIPSARRAAPDAPTVVDRHEGGVDAATCGACERVAVPLDEGATAAASSAVAMLVFFVACGRRRP